MIYLQKNLDLLNQTFPIFFKRLLVSGHLCCKPKRLERKFFKLENCKNFAINFRASEALANCCGFKLVLSYERWLSMVVKATFIMDFLISAQYVLRSDLSLMLI